jgi:Zn-dependent protease with chaperone function
MPGRWADLLAQSIVHALVAALAVEALVRVWRVAHPPERLLLRLLALAQPLLVTPALVLLWPVRARDDFHDRWALFSGRHWEEVRLLGWSAFELFVAALAAAGLALFLMDLVPLLRRGRGRRPAPGEPAPPELLEEVADLARATGSAPPPVRLLASEAPAVFCTGVRTPAVVVSRGALALLDPAERRAALAHELSHLATRDPLVSWLLMGVRALLFFNPGAQVLARTRAREAERRADDLGARASGDRLALASAQLKQHRATGGAPAAPRPLPFGTALSEPLRRARSRDVELRCRRLLDGEAPAAVALAPLRWGLLALTLPALLFFVT